jgi:hypothetical protein
VYQVVIKRRDHRGKWIIEHGPWLPLESDADSWALILQKLGYIVHVENMRGELLKPGGDNQTDDSVKTESR